MPATSNLAETALAYLRTPLAIRARCENVYAAALGGTTAHFRVEEARMSDVVQRVVATTLAAYPRLDMPIHGRLNHFRVGGQDRVAALQAELMAQAPTQRAMAWLDLVTVSVLLDAGAGPTWRYTDETGQRYGRSEGLALASLAAFRQGLFSVTPGDPLRVDARALATLEPARLAASFQVSATNQLEGSDGRMALVRRLGEVLLANPAMFPDGRPGNLLAYLQARAHEPSLSTVDVLGGLVEAFGEIWPTRETLLGQALGDVWRHPAAGGVGPTAGLVPFHKLSQWLAYSWFEPLAMQGIQLTHAGALTGLPEYRNGGLFVDLGVLVPKHAGVLGEAHAPGSELIVEWRALTVALLDRLADPVRKALGKSAKELPLGCILEGGTWAAGRQVAQERRPDGSPPIRIISDGTVF